MDDPDHPMVRMFALGKVIKLIRKYQDDSPYKNMNENTKKLLKGFYTANPMELEGDSEDHDDRYAEFVRDNDKSKKIMEVYNAQKGAVDDVREELIKFNEEKEKELIDKSADDEAKEVTANDLLKSETKKVLAAVEDVV
jgi:hypothetical protein